MKKIIIAISLIFILAAGIFFWWENGLKPVNSSSSEMIAVVIDKGEGTRQIVEKLNKKKLIRDPIIFSLLIQKMGVSNNIQAGVFYLSATMSAQEILNRIQTGKFDIRVTIPEGKRAEEIAAILRDKFPQYSKDWLRELSKHEGYLFPDTYFFHADSDIAQIIAIMRDTFDKRFSSVENNTTLSANQIVIIASMIEREAKFAQDREMVSSVIHNRLNIGMKLDIDATIQYALGYIAAEKRWWKQNLTFTDLKYQSPYNTYTNMGLPPGPICNPGLASLIAAANPAVSSYLYYLSDTRGVNYYAETYEDHNENIRRYR